MGGDGSIEGAGFGDEAEGFAIEGAGLADCYDGR